MSFLTRLQNFLALWIRVEWANFRAVGKASMVLCKEIPKFLGDAFILLIFLLLSVGFFSTKGIASCEGGDLCGLPPLFLPFRLYLLGNIFLLLYKVLLNNLYI